jgi:hypothetical protein
MSISFTTPSTAQVATQSNWIASNAVYDMRKPEIEKYEAKVWGSQDITGLFEVMKGGKNYVSANFGRHFEEDRLDTIIHATGTTQAALGAVTYTIVSGDTITSWPPVEDPYIATGTGLGGATLIPVRVNENLVFPGGVIGKVVSVSGATFTCIPTGSTDLPTVISTDEIWSQGLSVPEGFEGQLTSENWREHVVMWKSEIMREVHKSTGTALTQKTWVEFQGKDGQMRYNWWFKGQGNAYKKFNNKREIKWLTGEAVTNATTLASGYSAQYQQVTGLIPFAESFGNTPKYDLTTGMTLDDFNNIVIDTLSKNAGATENCLYESISLRNVVESFLRVEMQNGAIQYNQLGGKEAYVNLGFSSFDTLGYTFHNKTYSLFNDPTLLGAAGSKYKNFGFLVPMEDNMYQAVERKEKVMVPPMRINYLKLDSDNREWKERLTGWDSTNNGDYIQIDFLSENSPEFFGANRYLTLEGKNL